MVAPRGARLRRLYRAALHAARCLWGHPGDDPGSSHGCGTGGGRRQVGMEKEVEMEWVGMG